VFNSFSFFFFSKSDDHIILNYLNIIINHILISLSVIKYGVLNHNIVLFKHIFMYIRSVHIILFFTFNSPVQINLNLKNFLLSNFK
jgi:hypothetical protein